MNHSHIYTERLLSGHNFEMIRVEGGIFDMGGDRYDQEKPVHKVKLDSFCIGRYPVTQELWKLVMGNNPSHFHGALRPVETVSWNDTQGFLKKLSELTFRAYRLPTEAEWEYAARGGKYSRGYEYAGSNELKDVGWYWGNKPYSHRETKAVGQKFPNELGIYDMNGNVWEWCQDRYSLDYYHQCANKGVINNPEGPSTGSNRVLRGGGWGYIPEYCRVAGRSNGDPEFAGNNGGFRVAFSL